MTMLKNALLFLFSLSFTAGAFADPSLRCLAPSEAIQLACVPALRPTPVCDTPSGEEPRFAFDANSCAYSSARDLENKTSLVSIVATLPDGAVLPQSLLTTYSTTDLARAMVYRAFQRRDLERNSKGVDLIPYLESETDLFHEGEIQLAFFSKYAESIFQSGFLNQHQIGNSSGFYRPEQRAALEDGLIGLRLEETYDTKDRFRAANELRPKYAFLGLPLGTPGVEPALSEIDYGDVFAVLKPEVKQRTTLTNGDSLNWRDSPRLEAHTFKYRNTPFSLPRLGNYYEAQIWGKLAISDVAYFLVDCPGFYKTDAKFFEAYRNANVKTPIYSCRSTEPDGVGAKAIRPGSPLTTLRVPE
jgi:hypothetical protein